jgi:hypothetical protein
VAENAVEAEVAAEDEAARLRARLEVLEAELRMRNRELASMRRERRSEKREDRRDRRDITETTRNIFERADDQNRRFARAIVLSQLEQLRLTAELVGSFADEVARRNPADDPDVEKDLPRDIYQAMLDAVDRSIDIPEKTLDTFRESYKRAKRIEDDED